ncbi:MAG: MBL fold metallo-hydrolase [Dehalococcoidia bacterium]|nr:MBL fold metallo-hydrolase [Dehalococcoidia bacterium]
MVAKVQIARGIFRIGPVPTGKFRTAEAQTSPFVCVGQERAAILEPGEEGQASPILQVLEELGIERERVAYITASHIHMHHMEGINVLLDVLPNAKVVVHQRAVAHLIDPTRLNESHNQIWGLVGGPCARLNPVAEDRIIGCSGGEVLDLGGRELEIVDSRGHAPHHICVFDRLTGALWTGDMAGVLPYAAERGSPDILPPLFDVKAHIEGLRRCRALKPTVLFTFTGHGGVSYVPDQTLQWAEEDVLAIERICLDGMKNKLTAKEIGKRVEEVRARGRNTYSPLITPTSSEAETVGTAHGHIGILTARSEEHMPPFGMLAYLKRQDPSLEWPQGMPAPMGAGRGL